jgi:hypothetical protein
MVQLLAIPLLFILPGYALARLIARDRGAAFWVVAFLFSIPIASIAGFALARFGWFSLLALVAAVVVISFSLFVIRTKTQFRFDSVLNTQSVLVLVLAGAALFFYFSPPFEYFFGGRDPGIYVINGIRIAKTGSFTAEDPLVKKIPSEYRSLFFSAKIPLRYMGFFLGSSTDHRVIPNFFYLYPVWLATFYSMFGAYGMLYATPFLMICMLLAASIYVAFILGRAYSVGFILILGTTAMTLWFARFPNSEILAGCLIWIALFCFHFYREQSLFVSGIIGAICLAVAFWARLDAILLSVPLVLDLTMRWISGKMVKKDWIVLVVYLVFISLGAWHALTTNSDYILAAFENLRFKPYKVAFVVAGIAALVILFAIAGKRFNLAEKHGLGRGISIALAGLLVYAYFVRPFYPYTNAGSPNAGAFLALGWYFTHPVIVLALMGIVLYPLRFRSIDWILFGGTLVYSILYFYRIRGHAEHFWMLRRYLMLISPAIVFFAMYAAQQILAFFMRKSPKFQPRYASAFLLVASAALAGWFVYENRPLAAHKEYHRSFSFLEGLSRKLGPQDLLLIGAREANDLHIIAPMLSYYFDRNVLVLREGMPDLELLDRFRRSWKGKVYFVGTGNTDLASGPFFLDPIEDFRFETPVYDEIYHRRPRVAFMKYFQIGLYSLTDKSGTDPYTVDIGRFDDGNITNFHLKENYGRGNYRWTNGGGHVFFPKKDGSITKIVLRMNPGPWVPGMPKVSVKLYANGHHLVDLVLGNGYNTYEVPVPAMIGEKLKGVPVDLLIESKSWIPKRVLNLPDTRRVGVIVDWVKLQ